MSISLLAVLIAVGGAANIAAVDAAGAAAHGNLRSTGHHAPRRRLITKDEDIATIIRNNRGPTGHFDIEAEADDASTVVLHVDQMQPAVTPDTTFSFSSGGQISGDFLQDLTILSSNPRNDGQFTVMTVDTQSGDVRGIQRGSAHDTRQITLDSGSTQQTTLRARTMSHSKLNFTCGVDHDDDHHHDHHDHDHDHDEHRELSSLFDGHHNHEPVRAWNTTDTDAQKREGEHHFVINLLVAIDAAFIKRQGSAKAAARYVNFLVSSANVIYEPEISAHLNVVRIEEVDIFKKEAKTLRDGLRLLRQNYQGRVGNEINLVHAMLGQNLGGGIAFIDSVCDESWGVGLSSGLKGVISDLNDRAMHDAFMFAHEIGHSLGSGHTFDKSYYDPPVDTCGVECPAGLPLDSSASIMSYCNFCQGGLDNIALTLGGVWNGEGSRHDVNAWEKSPELVASSVSTDPHRVSHRIFQSLSAKGHCINPALKPALDDTVYSSELATPAPSASPTSLPTSRSPSTSPTSVPTSRSPSTNPSSSPATSAPSANPTTPPSSIRGASFVSDSTGVNAEEEHETTSLPPTVLPTAHPSLSIPPSQMPSSYPSWSPSETPSLEPSQAPSMTAHPSASIAPSQLPSASPSWEPSKSPSLEPSKSPSLAPSAVPSAHPTAAPSFDPSSSPTAPPTLAPSSSPIMSPTMQPTMQPITQQPTSSPVISYGPFSIAPEQTCINRDCSAVPGYMFSAKNSNTASSEITITAISFMHLSPKQQRGVELYRTISGSYSGREQKPEEWVKIATARIPRQKYQSKEIMLDTPITLARGETVGFYLKTEENIILVGKNRRKTSTSDGRLQLTYGSTVTETDFGAVLEGYSWNGAVTYSTAPTSQLFIR